MTKCVYEESPIFLFLVMFVVMTVELSTLVFTLTNEQDRSVGWCGVISALFRRHFVRGSDSFLLRLRSKRKKEKRTVTDNKSKQKRICL